MKLLKTTTTIAASFAASMAVNAAVIYSANFDALPDQAPLVASDGNASVSFTANSNIGDTNAAGDDAAGGIYLSTGANLATRNGMRAYGTTPNVNFTTASGGVAQFHTHTAGGYGVLSVGPIASIGGAGNQPTPIEITPILGDTYRVTFDMYVQVTRIQTNNLVVNWNLKDAAFAAFTDPNSTWNEYKNSSVGDVLSVTKDLVITQDIIDANVTSFGPQFTLFTNGNGADIATNTAFGQIDNYQIEHMSTMPEPSTAFLSALAALGVLRRRR